MREYYVREKYLRFKGTYLLLKKKKRILKMWRLAYWEQDLT